MNNEPSRQLLAAQISSAKLKPHLRQLALHLLRYANADGYVGMSVRDMYMSISGTEPGSGGFVQVNYHEVGKALESLFKAGVLAACMYNGIFTDVVVMRLAFAAAVAPLGELHRADEPQHGVVER